MNNLNVCIGWSLGAGFVSQTISRLDRIQWQGMWYPSAWSHIYWLFEWDYGPALIYESLMSTGVHVTPFDRLRFSNHVARHYEHDLHLDQASALRLWQACMRLEGARYDYKKIAALYAWIRFAGRSATRRPRLLEKTLDNAYICAEFTEATARQAKLQVDLCGASGTPATITPESAWLAIMGAPSQIAMPHLRARARDPVQSGGWPPLADGWTPDGASGVPVVSV